MDPRKWEAGLANRILTTIKNSAQVVLTLGLMIGIVDQISDDKALIEYKSPRGVISYTTVSLAQSACVSSEGQKVYFYKDYKIVTCVDNFPD